MLRVDAGRVESGLVCTSGGLVVSLLIIHGALPVCPSLGSVSGDRLGVETGFCLRGFLWHSFLRRALYWSTVLCSVLYWATVLCSVS